MRTIKKGISYNRACKIVEKNLNATSTKHNYGLNVVCFFSDTGEMVARYFEKYGKLQIRG